MALKVENRLYVWTSNGEREIQLCIGDITALPLEDKVDIIMVSAFLNDYTPIHGTLLGALYHNLGLNVRNLSYCKKEDLRHQFHCWLSQSLPDTLPYRQLICFEQNVRKAIESGHISLAQSVTEMFRAMMPVFNVENQSVITPLLGTGHQQGDMVEMLVAMVITAVEWMRMGLPLQVLKIVLFARDIKQLSDVDLRCINSFQKLKVKVEAKKVIPKEPPITADIFLVYCETDVDLAKQCKKYFKKAKSNVKVTSVRDLDVRSDAWQHEVFSAVMASSRVVPLLTPDFLADSTCIDQFNVALCCNRLTRRNILAPISLEKMPVPAYMNMVQWINCAPRSEELKLKEACHTLLQQVTLKKRMTSSDVTYDVFISYSHRNLDQAKTLLKALQELHSKPKIFFDYAELRTGVAWQQALYTAIDNSRCVIALLSPDYLSSAVCQEEFNLALVKHLAKEREVTLVPVCIQPVDVQPWAEWVSLVEGEETTDLTQKRTETLCSAVDGWLTTDEKDTSVFGRVPEPVDFESAASAFRQKVFDDLYTYDEGRFSFQNTTSGKIKARADDTLPTSAIPKVSDEMSAEEPPDACDVYISHTLRDHKYAAFLGECLLADDKSLLIVDQLKQKAAAGQGHVIHTARCLVVLLSTAYVESTKEVEEFNVILNRERQTRERRLLYVIKLDELAPKPTYLHLVPCDTALTDSFWADFVSRQRALKSSKRSASLLAEDVVKMARVVQEKHGAVTEEQCLPLLKAACDVSMLLERGGYHGDLRGSGTILHNVAQILGRNDGVTDSVLTSPRRPTEAASSATQAHYTGHCDGDAFGDHPPSSQGVSNAGQDPASRMEKMTIQGDENPSESHHVASSNPRRKPSVQRSFDDIKKKQRGSRSKSCNLL